MLRTFRSLLIFFISLFAGTAAAQEGQVRWQTQVMPLGGDTCRILIQAHIDSGWHIYDLGPYENGLQATTFVFEPVEGVTLLGPLRALDQPVAVSDDLFGEYGYFEGAPRFEQLVALSVPKASLQLRVEWMTCNEGSCTPPQELELTIPVERPARKASDVGAGTVADAASASAQTAGTGSPSDSSAAEKQSADAESPQLVAAQLPVSNGGGSGVVWSLILMAITWGVAACFTPCIFPMLPMTVSFFMKDEGGAVRGRFRALMYGLFIVALYTVPIGVIILVTWLVGGDAVTADIFNWLATHWLPNLVFFLVFMIFAASFFGAFEITLPSWMVNKSDSRADQGGLGGIFFMALTLVLVSFSCTGPLVGNVLIAATTTGSQQVWLPILVMLVFSVVFALPFTFFAFFPQLLKKMPKSGGWLNSVKVVLGFIEVALGLKFLSVADQTYHWGLLDREVYLAIWIAVFTLMGFYLLGKIRFAHDNEVKHIGVGRLFLVIVTFSFVIYLIPGMFGAPLKALSGYLPPLHTQDFVLQPAGNTTSGSAATAAHDGPMTVEGRSPKYSDFLHLPHGLTGFFDLAEAEAYAAQVGKPLFIDLTGHGCVNCREMEARVWSDPQVLDMLRNDYVVVALYVDDKKTLPESDWVATESGKVLKTLGRINSHYALKTWGVNAQPYYVLQSPDGQMLVPPRGYDLSVPGFVEFLRSGLTAFQARE